MQRRWQNWTQTLRRVGVLFISVVLAAIAIVVYFSVALVDVLVIVVAVAVAAAARAYSTLI